MTKSCATCHWHQQTFCAEPRNQRIVVTMSSGGEYAPRLEPATVEDAAVCDFHKAPMPNNYRVPEAAT